MGCRGELALGGGAGGPMRLGADRSRARGRWGESLHGELRKGALRQAGLA